ncbi:hypothetical protein HPP92_014213 [Vanilla planifolia]|uniref:Auxin response factor n=1 Tax=Vanilla planifolia TaxID=51239 RepID=A0A835R0W0_VANPL|nr:hypothetical protein HPP92_014213 [Vanilla planifolia]
MPNKGKAPAAAGQAPVVHPQIWSALAGEGVNIPTAGAVVYYFLKGHAEQAYSPPAFSSINFRELLPCYFICRLSSVGYHADPNTEEPFASFTLTSISQNQTNPTFTSFTSFADGDGGIAYFEKTLTKNDVAQNSIAFLDLPDEAKEVFLQQEIEFTVFDVNGRRWKLHRIEGGLLSGGWKNFVYHKMLAAGDVVVFVRVGAGTLFFGCRRSSSDAAYLPGFMKVGCIGVRGQSSSGFTRDLKQRVPPETVVEAARRLAADSSGGEWEFEGLFYPEMKLPVYVVRVEVVQEAMRKPWRIGLKVQAFREVQGEDKRKWYFGTVVGVAPMETGPWRMLEVTWDTIPCRTTHENPWDVEIA